MADPGGSCPATPALPNLTKAWRLGAPLRALAHPSEIAMEYDQLHFGSSASAPADATNRAAGIRKSSSELFILELR